jgi:UDP-N-acetylmuramoyl-tripeptide--D-alanyl-D-alanine ligase
MVAGLDAGATAVINADDPYADYWRGASRAGQVSTFGLNPAGGTPADFSAKDLVQEIDRGRFVTRFKLVCPLGEQRIVLEAGGTHNVVNALAAAAAAGAAGASLEDIAAGLGDFRPVSGRLQLKGGTLGSWIIDDSYNANPSSVRAGLDVLRSAPGPKWLVLGDMAELGEYATDSHAEMGTYARAAGVERLFALGQQTPHAVQTFGDGAEWFGDVDALTQRLQSELAPGVTLLVKGSRVNRLERVVRALTSGAT